MSEPRTGTMARLMNENDTRRRSILGEIEQLTHTRIAVYMANPNATPNFIDNNDPAFFNDLLESIGEVESLDLIIDSPGGEANVAERLAIMCRECCNNLRSIVINSAKSAATMLALATDEILMGYLSEIGPIDPQIRMVSPQGRTTFVPAQSILSSVGNLNQMLGQGIDQRIVMGLLQKIDTPMIDVAQNAINFSQEYAYRWLSEHMLKDDPTKAKEIAQALSDNRRWLSHGKRIGIREAIDLGLKVSRIRKDTQLWKLLWEYYGRVQIMMNSTATIKLFETKDMGINFAATVRRIQRPPQPGTPSTQTFKETENNYA